MQCAMCILALQSVALLQVVAQNILSPVVQNIFQNQKGEKTKINVRHWTFTIAQIG